MMITTNWLPRAAIVITLLLCACAARGPVIGGERQNVGGTISGVVRAAGNAPLSGRKVSAVNVETGARLETSTGTSGGYTLKVTPGHYRLEVELRPGETVANAPDEVHISIGDLDAGRDFVITTKG